MNAENNFKEAIKYLNSRGYFIDGVKVGVVNSLKKNNGIDGTGIIKKAVKELLDLMPIYLPYDVTKAIDTWDISSHDTKDLLFSYRDGKIVVSIQKPRSTSNLIQFMYEDTFRDLVYDLGMHLNKVKEVSKPEETIKDKLRAKGISVTYNGKRSLISGFRDDKLSEVLKYSLIIRGVQGNEKPFSEVAELYAKVFHWIDRKEYSKAEREWLANINSAITWYKGSLKVIQDYTKMPVESTILLSSREYDRIVTKLTKDWKIRNKPSHRPKFVLITKILEDLNPKLDIQPGDVFKVHEGDKGKSEGYLYIEVPVGGELKLIRVTNNPRFDIRYLPNVEDFNQDVIRKRFIEPVEYGVVVSVKPDVINEWCRRQCISVYVGDIYKLTKSHNSGHLRVNIPTEIEGIYTGEYNKNLTYSEIEGAAVQLKKIDLSDATAIHDAYVSSNRLDKDIHRYNVPNTIVMPKKHTKELPKEGTNMFPVEELSAQLKELDEQKGTTHFVVGKVDSKKFENDLINKGFYLKNPEECVKAIPKEGVLPFKKKKFLY